MQTFMPEPCYATSLACLDKKRLGKQRVETYQILRVLHGLSSGWRNHPAVRMWEGHEAFLAEYGIVSSILWKDMGCADSLLPKFHEFRDYGHRSATVPAWMGDERLHASHRSNLLRKDPAWYGQFGWTERPDMPYFWPTRETC